MALSDRVAELESYYEESRREVMVLEDKVQEQKHIIQIQKETLASRQDKIAYLEKRNATLLSEISEYQGIEDDVSDNT